MYRGVSGKWKPQQECLMIVVKAEVWMRNSIWVREKVTNTFFSCYIHHKRLYTSRNILHTLHTVNSSKYPPSFSENIYWESNKKFNFSYLMCVKTESSCSVRRPYGKMCPTIPGFIKPAINQRLIKRLGHSWRDWAMAENQQNITGAVIHLGGNGRILKCSQMVTGDKSTPWGVEISGATSVYGGNPSHPPLAAVLMWTTDEVNLNRAV